jgi:hypothetical protein
MTRTRYRPVAAAVWRSRSFFPSSRATPEATSTPDGSYSSIFGLRVLTNSPAPDAGVTVWMDRPSPVLAAKLYQSSELTLARRITDPPVVPTQMSPLRSSTAMPDIPLTPSADTSMSRTNPPVGVSTRIRAWLLLTISRLPVAGSTSMSPKKMSKNGDPAGLTVKVASTAPVAGFTSLIRSADQLTRKSVSRPAW